MFAAQSKFGPDTRCRGRVRRNTGIPDDAPAAKKKHSVRFFHIFSLFVVGFEFWFLELRFLAAFWPI